MNSSDRKKKRERERERKEKRRSERRKVGRLITREEAEDRSVALSRGERKRRNEKRKRAVHPPSPFLLSPPFLPPSLSSIKENSRRLFVARNTSFDRNFLLLGKG